MSYCVDKGIPHSEFLNWSIEDRSKTIAYISEQALTCISCGTAEWEWQDNPHAYAPEEQHCRGCYLKQIASEDSGKLPGTTIRLTPVNDAYRARAEAVKTRQAKIKKEKSEDD